MPSWQGAMSGGASGAGIGGMVGGPWGAGVGGLLGGLMGMFGNSGDKPMSPELKALYEQELGRQQNLNPMIEAVMRLAYSRMPGSSREGEAPSLSKAMGDLGPDLTQSPNGDYAQDPMIRKALQLQRVRMQMAQPLYEAVQRLAAQRMPRAYRPGAHWADDPRRQHAPPGFDAGQPPEGELG